MICKWSVICFMVRAKHVEEERAIIKSKDAKREISFDRGSLKNRLDVQDRPRIKKQVSRQVLSKFQKDSGYSVSKPKFKKVKGTSLPTKNPTCEKCGKKHYGDCLKGMDG